MVTAYKDWAPSAHDCKGLNLPDQQDWLVLPTTRNRDSGPLDMSNFIAALAELGYESDTVEVHRFGHWACGWFEIILAAPSRRAEVEALAERLDNYPVLDEDDLGQRELDAAWESWAAYAADDFRRQLAGRCRTQRAADLLDNPELLWRAFMDHGGEYHEEGSGIAFHYPRLTRSDVAAIIRQARAS